jgi:hypothetical protein
MGENLCVGVLLHGVRTADVFMDESEGESAVEYEGKVA